ncbi:MAG: carbon storage regulator [Candidatus Scalindua rubra]|uniref:Carbon storage regulator n=1 Tax=Candidatus Scalindua brodae TaxID=237368 RepID=A0A0B0EJ36_9BACT|nr:MAG: Carbon storage regulator [Candidatus Scalindua brodae]MBZ0108360.1 carbon storage regulator [Candidatus Scalindua rubra]TWU34058.1 carbon storage regulator [Candidatus Brocadiaceae bacterium S225]
MVKVIKFPYRDGITEKLVKTDKSQVKLDIEAPKDITINREEVYMKDQVEMCYLLIRAWLIISKNN